MIDLNSFIGKTVREYDWVRSTERNHDVKLTLTFTDDTKITVTSTHFVAGIVVDKTP